MCPDRNIILGISSGHDAGATLVIDGRLVAAASEERFKRTKHYVGFPEESIQFVIKQGGIDKKDIKFVARSGIKNQIFTFRNIKEYLTLPKWLLPIKLVKSLYFLPDFLKSSANKVKAEMFGSDTPEKKMLEKMGIEAQDIFVDHHLGHAAYSYYTSGYSEALVITLDGAGHGLSGSIYLCKNGKMKKIAESYTQGHSLGYFYALLTDGLGFKACDEEWKVMGLAAFGKSNISYNELRRISPSVHNLSLKAKFTLTGWSRDIIDNRLRIFFNDSALVRLLVNKYGREDVAKSGQMICEEVILKLISNAFKKVGLMKVAGGGGLFLNIKANQKILESKTIRELFVPPGPGDEGLSAGYALEAYRRLNPEGEIFPLQDAYLGPGFSDTQIEQTLLKRDDITYQKPENFIGTVVKLLLQGSVVGWFQGRMEWGPRALGARSVLADPGNPQIKDRINNRLKMRDWFMPFGPSVLKEFCLDWFENFYPSPFMNKSFKIRPEYRNRVPAVVHVDGTVRPHMVEREVNHLYHNLINEFYKQTGVPMVLNTSFNKHGLPIVCTPDDALDHLSWGCIDVLAIGSFIVKKR